MTGVFEMSLGTPGHYVPLGATKLRDRDGGRVRLEADSTTVEVAALAPDLFRVGMFPEGRSPRYDSEAIAKKDWGPTGVEIRDQNGIIMLSAGATTAHISLDPLRISFFDGSGRRFATDDAELGMGVVDRPGAESSEIPIGDPVRLYKRREEGERYFGCGQRTGGLEKTGSYQIFWNVDPPAGHTASLNNLYTSIPFTLSLRDGRAHGLFFDNTHRVELDLARENKDRTCHGAEGGDLVYYVFCGPTPRDVLK
ncbi:MAG TPA: alpha-glucosidase, partial [Rubrobacteraceae bacterium]|nr:alpha-glucosidase [Rubrobacteraceae bacterium]